MYVCTYDTGLAQRTTISMKRKTAIEAMVIHIAFIVVDPLRSLAAYSSLTWKKEERCLPLYRPVNLYMDKVVSRHCQYRE